MQTSKVNVGSTVSPLTGEGEGKPSPYGLVTVIWPSYPVQVEHHGHQLGRQQAQIPWHLLVLLKPWIQKTSEHQKKWGTNQCMSPYPCCSD